MPDFRFNTEELNLTKSERKIINYFYQHLSMIPFLSISKIAEELNISIATLSRFVRKLDFANFKELKSVIISHETTATPAGKLHSTLAETNKTTLASLLMTQEAYLAKTRENLSEAEVEKAIVKIMEVDTLYLFGKGASAGLAQLFAFRLRRFGKKTVLLPSSGSDLFEALVNVGKNDLVILFGFHKMPLEAQVILDHKAQVGYTTLLFTDQLYSEPAKQGDINLFVYRGKAKEYHSMAGPTALIDALVLLIAKELGDQSIESLSALYHLKEKYGDRIPR